MPSEWGEGTLGDVLSQKDGIGRVQDVYVSAPYENSHGQV
jgi:hypothetical protein